MGCGEKNMKDLQSLSFWKALLAELLGTLILVFTGCASCVPNTWSSTTCGVPATEEPPSAIFIQISLTFGIAVATVVWSIAHVSGGHITPAVTMGMFVARKITVIRAVLYIAAQCIGATVGAAILRAINPSVCEDALGYTGINSEISVFKGVGIETVITFVLVFTVFASCDGKRKDLGGSIPLAIGLSVTLCHLFAIKYTGSSMNPARSFGPAAVGGMWENHWVYWVGPVSGGTMAGLLYELIFAVDSSSTKMREMCTADGPSEPESIDNKPTSYVVNTNELTGRPTNDFRL